MVKEKSTVGIPTGAKWRTTLKAGGRGRQRGAPKHTAPKGDPQVRTYSSNKTLSSKVCRTPFQQCQCPGTKLYRYEPEGNTSCLSQSAGRRALRFRTVPTHMRYLFHMSSSWGSMEPELKEVISLHLPVTNLFFFPSFCFISGKLTDWISPFRGNPSLHWCVLLLDLLSRNFLQNHGAQDIHAKQQSAVSQLHTWIASSFFP